MIVDQNNATRKSKGVASGQISWTLSRHCLIMESENLKVEVDNLSEYVSTLVFEA